MFVSPELEFRGEIKANTFLTKSIEFGEIASLQQQTAMQREGEHFVNKKEMKENKKKIKIEYKNY